MADISPESTAGKDQGVHTIPEVPLKWDDFVWSLEKLRHSPYGKKTRERDWFRVNPLEMVLLGAQSIATDSHTRRDHGTMVLVMPPLRGEVDVRPRYWQRLISVLYAITQGTDTPPAILQRCCTVLIDLLKALERVPEYYPTLVVWALKELKIIEGFERLMEKQQLLGVQLSCEVDRVVGSLNTTLKRGENTQRELEHGEQSEESEDVVKLTPFLRAVLSHSPSVQADIYSQVQLSEMLRSDLNAPSTTLGTDWSSYEALFAYIERNSRRAVTRLLSIVQLFFVRGADLANQPRSPSVSDAEDGQSVEEVDQTSLTHTETDHLEGDQTTSTELEDGSQTATEADTGDESERQSTDEDASDQPPLASLFDALLACFKKWEGLCSPDPVSLSSVVCKLLSLTEVIMATHPLHYSLPEAVQFLHDPISLLMTYSTEGYLSNSPNEFFLELLEYVTSLVEHGTPPLRALQTNLPNLFGPMFGVHDHSVSCQLLEYGSLAVCSQHQKSLLTEGLRFLSDTFHLFPPIDEVKAQTEAATLRAEAVEVCSHLLEGLLSSLPLEEGGGEVIGGQRSEDASVETDKATSLTDQSTVADLEEGGAASLADKPKLADMEREADKAACVQVLLRLIQLACMMIRRGDNISFIYANVLPKLFQPAPHDVPVTFNSKKLQKFFGEQPPPPPKGIAWRVDKKKLAIHLMDLTILSLHNDVATPFELGGIMTPKLVKNVDRLSLSDEDKLCLVIDVLKTAQDILEEGHDINDFINYGIDLLSTLLPDSASGEEFRQFSNQMARHFVTSSQSSLLFLIKNACLFMIKSFPGEESGVRELFSTLVFRGKRDEIRGVFRVCKSQLTGDKYSVIRQHLYGYARGQLSHRQLVALCELLVVAMDLETPRRAVREVVTNVDDETEQLNKEREEQKRGVVSKLTTPCLKSIEEALKEGRFKKDVWEGISQQLSRVTLFTTLFQSEFTTYDSLSREELTDVFTKKFPPEVLANNETMQLLAHCATRIEHMQSPRYDSLKSLFSSHLRYFLTLTPSPHDPTETTPTLQDQPIRAEHDVQLRMSELERFLDSMPRNVEDRKQLLECGYGNKLWEERLSLTVRTDGSRSLEENMRQTLLACYREFSEILKQMAITHVSVDGELVKASELFSEELSLPELKGRRAVAVRAVDQRLGQSKDGHFCERKVTLLSREDQIETDFDQQSRAPVKPVTFTTALNTGFFSCAKCCGPQIIGCYAPNGEHCERPLEIGMRCDSAIASIYDESGLEIENVEILFTHEGAYVFKAYSNGHPYDTSQVWTALFVAMLREEPSPLVPSVIVPYGYPNSRTWETLRRSVSTEITGSVLTCRHDFSSEWRTYYDHRPERVRLGTDMVLTPGFSLTSGEGRPVLQRQRSRLTKDLAGVIFEEVIQKLLEDEWLKQFRFLGKVMSEYISVCIREGERRLGVLDKGFNYDRWAKTFNKSKQTLLVTSPPSKDTILTDVISFIDHEMMLWLETVDVEHLFLTNHKQLLELKEFLERDKKSTKCGSLQKQLLLIRELLHRCTLILPIATLPDALQEEIIHWVFGNEDRVWRYRGGRDGHETLQQFMSFLGRQLLPLAIDQRSEVAKQESENTGEGSSVPGRGAESDVVLRQRKQVYPGMVAFCLPELMEETGRTALDISSLRVRQMIGYAVGEIMRPPTRTEQQEDREEGGTRWHPNRLNQCYEVVTAWVHPKYRGLNMGVQMYFNIVEQAPARLVMCDMLVGSVERIVESNVILRLLRRMKIVGMIVQRRQLSYTVVTQTGHSEQFEQVLFDTRPLRLMLKVHRAVKRCKAHPKLLITVATVAIAIPVVTLTYWYVK